MTTMCGLCGVEDFGTYAATGRKHFGCNPWPLLQDQKENDPRACEPCNDSKVMPARRALSPKHLRAQQMALMSTVYKAGSPQWIRDQEVLRMMIMGGASDVCD